MPTLANPPVSTNAIVSDEAIRVMCMLGYTDYAVSYTLRVYRSRVAAVRAAHGIPDANPTSTGKPVRFTEAQCLLMRRDYYDGMEISELCEKYRTTHPTIHNCLASVETVLRPPKPWSRQPKPQPITPFPPMSPLDRLQAQEARDRLALEAELSRPPAKPIDLSPPAPDLIARLKARREQQGCELAGAGR